MLACRVWVNEPIDKMFIMNEKRFHFYPKNLLNLLFRIFFYAA